MYSSKIRNIELPENLFSNLGEISIKNKNKEKKAISSEKDKSIYESPKMTNYKAHTKYRHRISKMHDELKEIKPCDGEIDGVIYFNNYVEKGIVVKPKSSSLKQFWTEYRLINNEKEEVKKNNLNDFDTLFDALSNRVKEINSYIDELKEMRLNIETTSNKLEEDKEKLSREKMNFQNYKEEEEKKLTEEKENLKINFAKLQTIIDDLDKKLGSIEE